MAVPSKKRATYDDLLKYPEGTRVELVDGDILVQPRPASLHARATTAISGQLDERFHRGRGGPGGWVLLIEPELHLHGDALIPDLAGWRRARMPELPDVASFDLAPDWVCEIASPSTARHDRAIKLPLYARWGVGHLWIVDPAAKTLEAFQLVSEKWMLLGVFAGDESARIDPFADVELDLSALWAR